jgi:hypothetical protein
MKGLLYKDLKILTTSFRTLPLIVFIFLLVSVFNETGSFWSMYGIFMGCTMISTLQNLDESSKWCTFCDTLPLNRSDLVTEKYILSMIVTAASVALLVVMRVGFGLFGIGNGLNGLGVTCISMIMAGIVSSSITLMTAFLFGPQKSQIARLVVIVVMVTACMSIINFAPDFLTWLSGLSPVILLILGFVIPLGFAYLCYRISCTGFEKRVLA